MGKSGSYCHFCIRVSLIVSVLVMAVAVESAFTQEDTLGFRVIKTHKANVISLQVADIDNDNIPDIFCQGFMADINSHILFGRGNAEFDPPITLASSGTSAILAYLNRDTLLDVICSRWNKLYIGINNGNRDFNFTTFDHPYTNMGGLATGYINNDAYPDIIAAHDGTSYPYIYYGDGEGNFILADSLSKGTQTVYVSDFNNDGIDDIVEIDDYGHLTIYLNDGSGNLTKGGSCDLGGLTLGISTTEPFADFNHDGNADFAFVTPIISSQLSNITVGYGDGHGGISHMDTLKSVRNLL